MAATHVTRALMVLAAVAASLLATGCTVTGKQFFPIQGEPGKAILYVYRDRGVVGHGLALDVTLNDQPLASLGVGTFHATHVEPGPATFRVDARRDGKHVLSGVQADQLAGYSMLEVDVREAHVYYVEIEEGLGYVLLNEVPAEQALERMAKLSTAR